MLQIFWETLEDHTVHFRGGPLFAQWHSPSSAPSSRSRRWWSTSRCWANPAKRGETTPACAHRARRHSSSTSDRRTAPRPRRPPNGTELEVVGRAPGSRLRAALNRHHQRLHSRRRASSSRCARVGKAPRRDAADRIALRHRARAQPGELREDEPISGWPLCGRRAVRQTQGQHRRLRGDEALQIRNVRFIRRRLHQNLPAARAHRRRGDGICCTRSAAQPRPLAA